MFRYSLVGIFGIAVGAIATLAFRHSVPARATSPATDSAAYAGIAALHRADSVATIARDPKLLAELWDSLAVRVEGTRTTVTRAAIIASDSQFFARNPGVGVVQYVPRYSPPAIHGDAAAEWGSFEAEFVPKAGAAPVPVRGNVVRLLRRQPSGEWKFTHVIVTGAR